MHAVFIRAPVVEEVGPDVEVLATLADGRIVAVRQGPLMGTASTPRSRARTASTRVPGTVRARALRASLAA